MYSMSDLAFGNGYKPYFTQGMFEMVAVTTQLPSTCLLKYEQEKIIFEMCNVTELITAI